MRTVVRRAVLGLSSLALVSGGAVVAPAQAANAPSRDAAGWLAAQLQDGLVVSTSEWGTYTNYGASLDILFALDALEVRATARTSILEAVEPKAEEYVGSGTERYAGATGKLVSALQAEGVDPGAYGAGDLLDRLRARVVTEGAQQGRAVDQSEWGDYSNTFGQSWAVRALAGAADPLAASAAGFLLKQQCEAGFFRESMGDSTSEDSATFACDTAGDSTPSVDATALAVLALRAARTGGVEGLGDDIGDAVSWLRSQQKGNGSFVGNGVPNANSTGLAAWVLSTTRWKGAAGTAAAWLARQQVTARTADGTPLEGEEGAVAYDAAALAAGKEDGVSDADRPQWILATAQGAVALDALLPATTLAVDAPGRAVRDTKVRVKVSGLAPGERFTVRRGAKKVAAGWASGKGLAVVRVGLPKAGKVKVSVQGSRAARAGSTTVRVR